MSDVVDRLAALCRVPSVTGAEATLADIVAAGAPSSWPCIRIGNNLVFGQAKRPGVRQLALYGHLDTVPPPSGAHPEVRIEGDRLYGSGSSDMKAGLAVMQCLMAAREPLGAVDLVCVFYDKEEGPYVDNGLEPVLDTLGWLADSDLAICLEPSDNGLQMGCLGTLHATAVFEGRSAHSARPWQGRNAIQMAAPLLSRLAARPPLDDRIGKLLYREVINATVAHGGRARNMIPDRFELNLNYRFGPSRTLAQAQAELLDLVADEATVTFTDLCPSGPVCLDNPMAQVLIGLGLEPAPKQAWTDVARLATRGIDAVNLGPGISSQAHQHGEYTSISGLEAGLSLLKRFLEALG